MIKVNLCPIDEIESQYWYLPDVVAAAVVALVVFLGVQYYLGTVQERIDELTAQQQSLLDNTQRLMPELERFKNLGRDVQELDSKVKALQSITVSKIAKYKPLIVLEHFQNLRPDGVWFNSLRIGGGGKDQGGRGNAFEDPDLGGGKRAGGAGGDLESFEIKGQALDNILTAEFITAVRSTASQEMDEADLRTQVFFTDLVLEEAEIGGNTPKGFPDLARFPDFALRGSFRESATRPQPASRTEAPVLKNKPEKKPAPAPGAPAADGEGAPKTPAPGVSGAEGAAVPRQRGPRRRF